MQTKLLENGMAHSQSAKRLDTISKCLDFFFSLFIKSLKEKHLPFVSTCHRAAVLSFFVCDWIAINTSININKPLAFEINRSTVLKRWDFPSGPVVKTLYFLSQRAKISNAMQLRQKSK